MNLRGITVCVNYADLLGKSLERWHTGLDRLVVVTSPADADTLRLCDRLGVETFATSIFYENGAKFNKGAALSQAIIRTRLRRNADWLMTFDSDIVPPHNWRVQLDRHQPRPGGLYGAYRYQQPENAVEPLYDPARRMPQGWVLGFFMAFHATDPVLPADPLFDVCWPHAGNYDTTFCRRWAKVDQHLTSIPMVHLGEERQNWVGRGKLAELRADYLGHRIAPEDWERERMANPPIVQ